MNGMNLMNSSPNTENMNLIARSISLNVGGSMVPLLTIPNWLNIASIATEYIIYPAKRATTRTISLRDGILNIAL